MGVSMGMSVNVSASRMMGMDSVQARGGVDYGHVSMGVVGGVVLTIMLVFVFRAVL